MAERKRDGLQISTWWQMRVSYAADFASIQALQLKCALNTMRLTKLRVSLATILVLSVCQLNSYAIEPGEPLSVQVSDPATTETSFEQRIFQRLKDQLAGISVNDVILRLLYSPQRSVFHKTVFRSTSIEVREDLPSIHNSEVICRNNDGVNFLNAGNFPAAIDRFISALQIDPDYKLAHDNLAIAYNNYGLKLRQPNPVAALSMFQHALYMATPSHDITQQNVDGMIREIGRSPHSFDDRIALGDRAYVAGDFVGALVEYKAALSMKDSPDSHSKLSNALSHLTISQKLLNPSFIDSRVVPLDKIARIESSSASAFTTVQSDLPPYMLVLQQTIEKNWLPPEASQSSEVKVLFNVNQKGELTECRLSRPAHVDNVDQAAIAAIQRSSPFPPPPHLKNSTATFELTFSYRFSDGPVDFSKYMQNLSRKIKAHWITPSSNFDTRVVLLLTIDGAGNLQNLKSVHSSGSKELDLSAENAVRSAAPFAPLPSGADPQTEIEFTFDCQQTTLYDPQRTQDATSPDKSIFHIKQTVSENPYPFESVRTYVAALENKLSNRWIKSSSKFSSNSISKSRVVTVLFRVGAKGDVSDLRLYGSSGDPMRDTVALETVRNCSPFPKPPLNSLPLDVQYTFM